MKRKLSAKCLAAVLVTALSISLIPGTVAKAYIVKKSTSTKETVVKKKKIKYEEITGSFNKFALMGVKVKDKWGFINIMGELVVKPQYDDIDVESSEGLALVIKSGKYGYINDKGKEVIPLEYEYADSFSDGCAVVKKGLKYGFIDKKGKEITPFIYQRAEVFNSGYAAVKRFCRCI